MAGGHRIATCSTAVPRNCPQERHCATGRDPRRSPPQLFDFPQLCPHRDNILRPTNKKSPLFPQRSTGSPQPRSSQKPDQPETCAPRRRGTQPAPEIQRAPVPPWRPPESLSPLPCAGPCPSPERIRATQGSDFSGGVAPRLSAGTGLQITGAPPASTQAPAISRVSKSRSSRCSAAPGRRPTRLHCVPVSPRRPSHLAPASSERLSLNLPPCPPAIPDRRRTAPPHRISGSLDQTAIGASPPAPATAEVNRPWSTARTLCPRVRPRRSRLRPSGPRPTALSSAADPRGPPPHRCPRTVPPHPWPPWHPARIRLFPTRVPSLPPPWRRSFLPIPPAGLHSESRSGQQNLLASMTGAPHDDAVGCRAQHPSRGAGHAV